MDKFIGKTLDDRYTIEEIIGVGGMAVVYKTKDSRLNRYVALKVLKEEYAVDRDFRRRFHDESQAVAMLSHPNIVTVYDVSRTDNTEYIVMELIDGITLKDYMRKRGTMTWKEITFFSIQIAKALEHAHSRGIIHRDIKPQNIMLLRDGTVKVADFGIARHVSKQDTYNMGEAIGSVHYVSPEQARGSFIDNRADIYSFGVVMYEMITGRLPFEGDTPIAVALQHINSIALPPHDFIPDVPPALEAITLKAMDPNLAKRYTSATDMLVDLESYRNDPNYTVTIVMDGENQEDGFADDENGHTRRINNTGEVEKLLAATKGQQGKNGASQRRERKNGQPEKGRPAKKERPDSSFPTSIIFSLLAVLLFFGGAIYFIIKIIDPFGNPERDTVTVPYLIGQNIDNVLAVAEEQYGDFVIEVDTSTYSDTVDAGTITAQDPAARRSVEKGTVIKVDISLGAKSFELEDYTGLDFQIVEARLTRVKLEYIRSPAQDNDLPENAVIRTEPVAGTIMTAGDTVLVYVNVGPEVQKTRVPDVIGMTLEEAATALFERNLGLGNYYYVDDEDAPADTIVFQFLPVNTEVDEGSTVDVNVSRGPKETEPPTEPETEPPATQPPVTTEPPATSGIGDTGNYYRPDWHAGRTDLVYYDYPVTIEEASGSVVVKVYVDNFSQYVGTHVTSDGTIYIRLESTAGDHALRIYQGDNTYVDTTVTFR